MVGTIVASLEHSQLVNVGNWAGAERPLLGEKWALDAFEWQVRRWGHLEGDQIARPNGSSFFNNRHNASLPDHLVVRSMVKNGGE